MNKPIYQNGDIGLKENAMKLIKMVLAAGCLWAGAALADPPKDYPFVDFDTGLKAAKASGKPIFVYFGRYGCAWCDHTNKKTFSNAGLKKLYSENYALVYVDAESGKRLTLPSGERITEAELGARLQAFATPLFVYMTPQGEKIMQVPGFKTVQDFQDYDRYVRGGHYKQKTLLEFLGGKS
jgi:thioredoxin-related protein